MTPDLEKYTNKKIPFETHKITMKATKENMIRVLADDKQHKKELNLLSEKDLDMMGKIRGFWK